MPINILSLFDGMSCGQIALERCGVKSNKYFASEIKPYAIKVTQHNYPNTIQLGSVLDVKAAVLPKIDLLIGGSPCQSFSIAGNRSGFDGKSKLFWEYVRILNEVKPKYFLLENVVMKKEWEDVITKELGVKPIKINSTLVSAQNRPRLYWTNIPGITIPNDKKIYLKDVLGVNTNQPLKDGIDRIIMVEKVNVRKHEVDIKALQELLRKSKNKTIKQISQELQVKKTTVEHWFRTDSCFSIPDADIWKNLKSCLNIENTEFDLPITEFIEKDNVFDMGNRVYKINGKSPTLTASSKKIKVVDDNGNITILNRTHFEKLQTVPIGYTKVINEAQAMNLMGDGWTVDVIAHILSFMA